MPIRTPYLATDSVIECFNEMDEFEGIVLIERKNAPHGLALPGGFVDVGERVEDACRREMKEETGLDVKLQHLLGVYSDPERDPRFHSVSVVYVSRARGLPVGGDDAKTAHLFHFSRIPWEKLVFDHEKILRDYLEYKDRC
ncbi:NUDIX domain-containing protein [Hydrogenimonas urashimensis]|uniref:NUDIX domain-containing protein n=1 Tax=Hydrogenimonas urashimensis TaxID=2740515 RepID=UPI001915E466|nr:NUDIX hydrolase [Hydrogenimonas urashimensis]